MSRIEKRFSELKKKAFIPFITAGDPSLQDTPRLIKSLESAGADIIELGVPFSDPIADGPAIQRASLRALDKGASLRDIINMVTETREMTQIPIVLMGYYNPIYKYGAEKFIKDAAKSGVDGIIVADLPPEEGEDVVSAARENDLSTIFLIAPTSTPERVKLISESCTGFVYCVSSLGVTGARNKISDMLNTTLDRIRNYTDKPVAAGFGVSNPDQAGEVAQLADGVIIGSAIVNVIEKHKDDADGLIPAVKEFASDLNDAIKKV